MIVTYTPTIGYNRLDGREDDIKNSPRIGTVWKSSKQNFLYPSLEFLDIEGEFEHYKLIDILSINQDAILLFLGNEKIAITGWNFLDRSAYEPDRFYIKNVAAFLYNGRKICALYSDYIGLWDTDKHLTEIFNDVDAANNNTD